MARPSRDTDKRLLLAARELIPQTGFAGLKLRKVAAQAKVNLGMFHYHFKDKQDFLQRVLQDIYDEFFKGFSLVAIQSADPPQRKLQKALQNLAAFLRDHRQLILALAIDAMRGEAAITRFLEKNFHRHIIILIRLMQECQRTGAVVKIPIPISLIFMVASIVAPNIIVGVLERIRLRQPLETLKHGIMPFLITDKMIALRIQLALQALTPLPQTKQSNVYWKEMQRGWKSKVHQQAMDKIQSALSNYISTRKQSQLFTYHLGQKRFNQHSRSKTR